MNDRTYIIDDCQAPEAGSLLQLRYNNCNKVKGCIDKPVTTQAQPHASLLAGWDSFLIFALQASIYLTAAAAAHVGSRFNRSLNWYLWRMLFILNRALPVYQTLLHHDPATGKANWQMQVNQIWRGGWFVKDKLVIRNAEISFHAGEERLDEICKSCPGTLYILLK